MRNKKGSTDEVWYIIMICILANFIGLKPMKARPVAGSLTGYHTPGFSSVTLSMATLSTNNNVSQSLEMEFFINGIRLC